MRIILHHRQQKKLVSNALLFMYLIVPCVHRSVFMYLMVYVAHRSVFMVHRSVFIATTDGSQKCVYITDVSQKCVYASDGA